MLRANDGVGVVPLALARRSRRAGAALYFAYCGPRRVSVSLLLIALVVYVVSALFADAGSHGWDGLRYFPKVG